MKKALVIGITGQDGAYLANLLLEKGYDVVGASRDADMSNRSRLAALGIEEKVPIVSMSLIDFRSVLKIIFDVKPSEIYNLSGQSSVGLSFEQPIETMQSILTGTMNLLEVMRLYAPEAKLYSASSSECFGETPPEGADESHEFRPRSPYAVAKAAAHWAVANYREAYNLFATSGILFNHESPLRPRRFVTRKIVEAAVDISKGLRKDLHLGNLEISRDWGWAPEFVDAMHRILQQDEPHDIAVCTGEAMSLREFVDEAFAAVGLKSEEYVVEDKSLIRPSDITFSKGNPERARKLLGWEAQTKGKALIHRLVEEELGARAEFGRK